MSSYDVDRGSSGIIKNYDGDLVLSQEIKVGQKVRVKHFSVSEYAVSEIIESSESSFKIKMTPKLIRGNVFKGDSITVILINSDSEECLVDGIVEQAQAEFPQFFLIRSIRIRHFKDCRKSRRYQIDACCNLRDDGVSSFGNIKNISTNGCRIMTKIKIDEKKNLKMELFIEEHKKVCLDVGVVREKKHMNYNEYGLVILGMDEDSKIVLRDQINKIILQEKAQLF